MTEPTNDEAEAAAGRTPVSEPEQAATVKQPPGDLPPPKLGSGYFDRMSKRLRQAIHGSGRA
jgi:hypothetical protein